ncbi:MAG: hypothetical protein EBR82_43080 [Caulobacteraceae bacterium]|nr:hypothetical protein [Caulobacteraceae bacterium]
MITLNGKKFAKNDAEFTASLFDAGGTCVGYYKRNKKSVTLMNMQREKIGVINSAGVLCCATNINGKTWYSHADIKEIGAYASYMQQVNECKNIIQS